MNSDYKLIYHKDALKFLAKQEVAVQERDAKSRDSSCHMIAPSWRTIVRIVSKLCWGQTPTQFRPDGRDCAEQTPTQFRPDGRDCRAIASSTIYCRLSEEFLRAKFIYIPSDAPYATAKPSR